MLKIGLIAPNNELAELFGQVCIELKKDITIILGDLKEGVSKALELEGEGFDVIISRGGTSMAIKNVTHDIPVIDIMVTSYDIIRALNKAKIKNGKIAIVGFGPFTYAAEEIGSLMDIDLKVITLSEECYNNQLYIEQELLNIRKNGYHRIVGDSISVKIASELGMDAYLIQSGKEALIEAINEAEKFLLLKQRELEKTKRIETIISYASEGIISFDKNGVIDIFNPKAEEVFRRKLHQVTGRSFRDVLPEELKGLFEKESWEIGKVWSYENKNYVGNIIPIIINEDLVRVVITFQEASQIKNLEKKLMEELYLKGHTADNNFSDIIGRSREILSIIEEAGDYAQIDSPILIYGETGTGKELFAQAVHNASKRKNKPFVAFNCAALPENLIESELFGYVEGAFTGAKKSGKAGMFEQAEGGSIFLDEIGETSLNTQLKLLRVLQEKKIRRLGDDRLIPINVRVIVATNKKLLSLVNEKRFREDLYYRVNVLNLNIPPLRNRVTDIPLLVDFFLLKYKQEYKHNIISISQEGMSVLQGYNWPGNIRQLENIVERLIVRTKGNRIPTILIKDIIYSLDGKSCSESGDQSNLIQIELTGTLAEMEKKIIARVLEQEAWNKGFTANRLGIGRATLWRKIKDFDVS